ncbi:MAG: SHOCT domain-containing protein [Solirubrobacterales bacterium]
MPDGDEETKKIPETGKAGAAGAGAGEAKTTKMEASGPRGETPWDRSKGRRIGVRVLLVLGTILAIVSMISVWARDQALDNATWNRTSAELLANPQIQTALGTYLVDQLYDNVDVPAEIEKVLPENFKPLAPVAAAGARDLIDKAAIAALGQPAIESILSDATNLAHSEIVTILDGGGQTISTQNGQVTLDLGAALQRISQRVGLPASISEKLPPDSAVVPIVKSQELERIQNVAKALKAVAVISTILAILSFVLAVWLASGRRGRVLGEVGAGLVIAGLAVIIIRDSAGSQIVNSLVTDTSIKPAATSAWNITSSLLGDLAVQSIVLGVIFAIAGFIGSQAKAAVAFRRRLAPMFNERPEIAFLTTGILLLLFLLWGPIPATRNWWAILIFIALTVLGTWGLWKQSSGESPDARFDGDGLKAKFSGAGAAIAGAGRSVKEKASTAASGVKERASADKTVRQEDKKMDKLERLVALRDGGALTEAEFEAEKKKLLDEG